MSKLRGYQHSMKAQIYDTWNRGAKCVIGVTATGSGKTVIMGDMAHELQGNGVAIAHRAELVGQISIALAREGVRHNITAARKTIKAIVAAQMDELGRNFYDPGAKWNVASVDTVIRRELPNANAVNWVFCDEGHHCLTENKWGRAAMAYPNARILLVTATPTRTDGKGLGSHADGIADAMVIGPGLADLISQGYLVNYKVYAPQASDLDLSDVHITAGGEFNQQEVARAVKRSNKIVGDVVEHYLAVARGKLGITFAVDIEHAETLTAAFNAAGVPAALVTAETEEAARRAIMRKFRARELLQLVNVDLFGEGVDVPGVEVVSMARPTASFSLYAQQIGRMLRLNVGDLMSQWEAMTVAQRLAAIAASAKPFAILLDHVGNVRREFNVGGIKYNGLPEGFNAWSLDARARRSKGPADDAIPLRTCLGCFQSYERIYDSCPHCGQAAPEPGDRSKPEFVDGNIFEIDGAELARMRGEIARIDGKVYTPQGVTPMVQASIIRKHHERQAAQHHLRETIALWAGKHAGSSDTINYRRFFHTFGLDVATALALGAGEAEKLKTKIEEKLQ